MNIGSLRVQNGVNCTPINNEGMRWQYYGWTDVRMGLGIRKSYEDCEEHIQRNYEMGRAYAIVFKREWGVVPEWRPDLTIVHATNEAMKDNDVCRAFIEEHRYHFKHVEQPAPTPQPHWRTKFRRRR